MKCDRKNPLCMTDPFLQVPWCLVGLRDYFCLSSLVQTFLDQEGRARSVLYSVRDDGCSRKRKTPEGFPPATEGTLVGNWFARMPLLEKSRWTTLLQEWSEQDYRTSFYRRRDIKHLSVSYKNCLTG